MFTHRVREEHEKVNRFETWSAEVNGYDVVVVREKRYTRLSICPKGADRLGRVGIIECHPKNVTALEELAVDIGDLLRTVAARLREAGLDDLRSDSERDYEEISTMFRQRREKP